MVHSSEQHSDILYHNKNLPLPLLLYHICDTSTDCQIMTSKSKSYNNNCSNCNNNNNANDDTLACDTASLATTTSSCFTASWNSGNIADSDGTKDDDGDYDQLLHDDDDDDHDDIDAYHQDESMNSLCEGLGLLFEGSHATTWKHFSWDRTDKVSLSSTPTERKRSNNNRKIQVAVSCIDDDDPGAVQSGHYLWPAAQSLCDCLISSKRGGGGEDSSISSSFSSSRGDVRSVLELGAGTALPSLCAHQLYRDSLEYLVVTDRDYGTLERARDNYETTLMELYEDADTEEGKESVVNEISSTLVEFLPLSWGGGRRKDCNSKRQWKELQKRVHKMDDSFRAGIGPKLFDLVLGSDLIYSFDVVEPLLQTAKMAMSQRYVVHSDHDDDDTGGGRFLLSQSFPLDAETEQEIDHVCRVLHLSRKIILEDNGSKVQEFRHLVNK